MSRLDTREKPARKLPLVTDEQINCIAEVLKWQEGKEERNIFRKIANRLDALKIAWVWDEYGNIIATNKKADAYVCFCCHMDTVHSHYSDFTIFKIRQDGRAILIATDEDGKREGIGGDDRCGVWLGLELLKSSSPCKVIFFSEEESGCRGSKGISLGHFDNVGMLIGLDRWGSSDIITEYLGDKRVSKTFLKEFQPLLDKYHFKEESGLMTDCFTVQGRGVNLCTFNLSVGYYQHHTDEEWVDCGEMLNTLALCKAIIKKATGRIFGYKIPTKVFAWNKWNKKKNKKWTDKRIGIPLLPEKAVTLFDEPKKDVMYRLYEQDSMEVLGEYRKDEADKLFDDYREMRELGVNMNIYRNGHYITLSDMILIDSDH